MVAKVVESLKDIGELEIDFSSADKPAKKTRRTYTASDLASMHGVTIQQVLEANGSPKKTKGSDFVNKAKVDRILKAAKLAESEAKAEDDKAEPDAKTLLNAEFFEGEPAPPSNDVWAVSKTHDSNTAVTEPASTIAARLGIKVEDLLQLFGIKFKLRNNEANGLKPLDVDQAERHFQDVCDYFDAIAKAEAKAKADAEAQAKAIAKAEAEAKAKAKADAEAKAKQKQPVAEAPEADAEHQVVLNMADQIDRIRQTENAKAKAEAEAKSEADIAEAIARIKKEAEAKSKDETKVEVEASAKAETEVEADDDQSPGPYIVCGPKAEQPEAPEAPQLKDTPEETPPNDTAPEGTVDFDEFTQKFLDRARSVIMRIESLA